MFHKATQRWFDDNFERATTVQQRGWASITSGSHSLLVAPTGSGKTLAAFLASIDRLGSLPSDAPQGFRVLYISPLKALVYDIERNLRAPLVGITRVADKLGVDFRGASVAIRTGDTPQKERQRQAKHPGEILVTTPESLYLILGSKAAATLATVETIIIDEIHALAPGKRGAHLALSLERLSALTERDPQRIGLSATVRPLDAVARFLGGNRQVNIVDCSAKPALSLAVTVPVPDMQNPPQPTPEPQRGGSILGELYAREVATPTPERGIWPTIYPELLDNIKACRSAIIFVNSRGLCERLSQKLNEMAGEELVRAHHGSISHEKRAEIEDGLKSGNIRGIVATSSLELGIDMGAVDLVMLVESPGSVARGLQRVGRAGHGVGEVSAGRIFPKFRGDLLECAVVAGRMEKGELEAIEVPVNALDVLSQQIVAICCQQPTAVDDIETLVRRADNYRELSRNALEAVLDMLCGRYPSSDFADLKPLLSWDRSTDVISPRRGAAMVTRMNAGTIPDRGAFGVHLGEDGPRVGELDEEMVFETRAGDNIMLGSSTWTVENITRDRVIVSPAPGQPGRLPFWRGDGPGRPIELGRAIGAFVDKLGSLTEKRARKWLQDNTALDAFAARNLAAYVSEQKAHCGSLPTDRTIVIERFRDELGDWRVCILTPFGARIHAPWAMALERTLAREAGYEIQVMYTDDGIVLRFADAEELPGLDALIPDPEEVEELVTDQLSNTSLFAGLFRENAVRSLLLRRRRPGQRSPLWAQRLKAQNLLATVRQYPRFPIVIETYRQAMADVFNLPGLRTLLGDIRSRTIQVDDVETRSASPFARSLVFAYVAAYLYEQDAPLAERKAQALTLDRALLGELLGQAELRELIDRDVLQQLEDELQHIAPEYHARDADDVHDLLRRLGDLTDEELAQRCTSDPAQWLESLHQQRRAVRVRVAGEQRWIAAEDAGLYRDALGVATPAGIPEAFLDAVDRPMPTLLRRYARHRGPFLTREPAARFDLQPSQVEPVLTALETDGVLVRGEIRPGGLELDWCDSEVLRRLKRRNLAALRDEVAAVDTASLALFLPAWQGVGDENRGQERLLEAIASLQDLPVPWSLLSTVILPARVPGFRVEQLDVLAAAGALVWLGRGSSGARDGRVSLYLRTQVRELMTVDLDYKPPTDLHAAVLDRLKGSGASFLMEIQDTVRAQVQDYSNKDLNAAIWDLVWAGQITNDTFGPLNDLGRKAPRRGRRRGGNMLAGGRWSLVSALVPQDSEPTVQTVARTRLLLDRYGIVSRQCTRAEDIPGGFGPIYKVLREMEEQGRVRRGYFVEGLPGAQFAYAGAVDRLRASRGDAEERDRPVADEEIVLLPAMDPANPFGALVDWPQTGNPEQVKPRRVAGAWVILARGRPVLYAGSRARNVMSFPETVRLEPGALNAAINALRRLPRGYSKGILTIEKIDGIASADSPLLQHFSQNAFVLDYRGLIDVKPMGASNATRMVD
ncbi:MAG: DEAD/DEAH box helicase [Pseudomonadota bacterium]